MIQKNTHDSRFCDYFDKDSRTQDLKEKRRINRAEGEAEDSKQSGRAEFPVVFLVDQKEKAESQDWSRRGRSHHR